MRIAVTLLAVFIGSTALSVAGTEQVELLFGDVDGFGFPTVAGLVDENGNAADRDGDGALGDGDSLPDLDGNGSVSPTGGDAFDNRTPENPLATDAGVLQNTDLLMPFTFEVPAGMRVSSAMFSIVVGDASLGNASNHRIVVDGIDSGEVVEPITCAPGGDGLITVTEVALEGALLAAFSDGAVDITVTYATHPDDIAVDHARSTRRSPRSR